jgi:hypothetical protein
MCRHFLDDFGVQTRVARYPGGAVRKIAHPVLTGRP